MGEYGHGQQSDDAAGDDLELHGETAEYQELEVQEQTHGYDHEMDNLVDDMNRMRAGPPTTQRAAAQTTTAETQRTH